MLNKKRSLILIILIIIFAFFSTTIVFSNSVEPPSIIVIIRDAPENLEVEISPTKSVDYVTRSDKLLESHFSFYLFDYDMNQEYKLMIKSDEKTLEFKLGGSKSKYNNVYTVDIVNGTIVENKPISRIISDTTLRILFTLLIEGIIFFLFGFRQKKSWIIFLIINLITQGGLNIWLNGFSPSNSYIIFNLIYGEIFVLIFEFISFMYFIKEKSKLRTFFYVLIANVLSLIVGGYVLMVLPI